jgi:hypothetical protein
VNQIFGGSGGGEFGYGAEMFYLVLVRKVSEEAKTLDLNHS